MNFDDILFPVAEINKFILYSSLNVAQIADDDKYLSLKVLLDILDIMIKLKSEKTIKFILFLSNQLNINLLNSYYGN